MTTVDLPDLDLAASEYLAELDASDEADRTARSVMMGTGTGRATIADLETARTCGHRVSCDCTDCCLVRTEAYRILCAEVGARP